MGVAGKRLLIGTPCLDGKVDMRFAYSLAETVRLGERMGVDVQIMFRGLDAMLQRVRNDLVRDAMEGEYTDLLFIDDDQDWTPADVFRLLAYPVDVVGAPVRKKSEDHELYNVTAGGPFLPVDAETGLMQVDAVGTGFLRLSKQAMLALWNRSEEYRDDAGKRNRWMFDIGPNDRGRLVGEDVTMCMKLRDAGLKVWIAPGIVVGHTGTKRWSGAFGPWLKKLQESVA